MQPVGRSRLKKMPFLKKLGHCGDPRISLLAYLALVLCAVLVYRIPRSEFSLPEPLPSLQLLSRNGTLSLEELPGMSVQERISPDLTPFFFQPIPVNFADAELIATIKGIGPRMADKIVQTRTLHGVFAHADALGRVPGLGPKRISQLKNQFSFQTQP